MPDGTLFMTDYLETGQNKWQKSTSEQSKREQIQGLTCGTLEEEGIQSVSGGRPGTDEEPQGDWWTWKASCENYMRHWKGMPMDSGLSSENGR